MKSIKLTKKANVLIAIAFLCISLDGNHELYGENMLLMIPPILAKKKAEGPLSGYWYYTHNGYELNMSQNGDQLTATYTNLSSDATFNIGDQAFYGTLKDNNITGKIRSRFPIEIKEVCPNNWEIWADVNMTLSDDLHDIQGQYKTYTIYSSDCHVEDGDWQPINVTRTFTPILSPAKAIEVKITGEPSAVIIRTKDQKIGAILNGEQDSSGNLKQVTDITYFNTENNNINDVVHLHIDPIEKTLKFVSPDGKFVVIDNYNPVSKTVTKKTGDIDTDGTEHVTSTEENIKVDDTYNDIVNPDDTVSNIFEGLNKVWNGLQLLGKKMFPPWISWVFTVKPDISQEDRCIIDNVSGLVNLLNMTKNITGWIHSIFILKETPVLSFIKTLVENVEKLFSFGQDDGADKVFKTCGAGVVCCYQLQELCRKYGDEIYSTQCTCTILTYDEVKKIQIMQECESIGGVSESVGDFVWCKQWDLEPPSKCENP
ncbi:hypothetical protein GCAAIG_00120 [Candidatus Electronema halotolerans]